MTILGWPSEEIIAFLAPHNLRSVNTATFRRLLFRLGIKALVHPKLTNFQKISADYQVTGGVLARSLDGESGIINNISYDNNKWIKYRAVIWLL